MIPSDQSHNRVSEHLLTAYVRVCSLSPVVFVDRLDPLQRSRDDHLKSATRHMMWRRKTET